MTTPIKSVSIYGVEVAPTVGSLVLLDGRTICEGLLPGNDFADSGFRGCQFYFPINKPGIKSLACDVEITGKTKRKVNGDYYVRCKIIWVGDCEPDTTSGGWLRI